MCFAQFCNLPQTSSKNDWHGKRSFGAKLRRCFVVLASLFVATCAGCFVAPHFTASPTGPLCRDVAQQASGVKRVRKVVKPKAKVKKLGKSRQGSSEDSVWDYIREKDKAALEEGAFMETFAGKAVETTVYVLCFLIILWEIYLNTIYPRAAPTYNPMDNVAVMEGNEVAY